MASNEKVRIPPPSPLRVSSIVSSLLWRKIISDVIGEYRAGRGESGAD